MFFKYVYIALYIITLSFGFYHFKKLNQNKLLKFWLGFLTYSFLNELISRYIIEIHNVRTIGLSNTWFLVNSFFYLLFYFFMIESTFKKKIILILISLFFIFTCIRFYYQDFLTHYFVYSWIVGQLFIVIAIMIYFIELLNGDKILKIQKSLFFWISIGVLFFNIGLLPVFVIGELIDWQGIFDYIILVLNIMLSLCFITGFIVSKKEFNN